MRTCRIIFVPFIRAFAGVERLILGLSRFLHEHGLAHRVVCFAETIGFQSYAAWPMKVHQLAPARNPLVEGWSLHRYLSAVHVPGGAAPLLFDLKGAFYAGMFPMPPYNLHLTDPPSLLHGETSNRGFSLRGEASPRGAGGLVAGVRGEIVHRINKRGTARAQSVVVMSDSIADELRAIYSIAPRVIRPGVAAPSPSRHARQSDEFRALSVCRLEPSKRVDWILRAWARLHREGSAVAGWKLDIAGGGSEAARLRALAGELGIAEKVLFHGAVSNERLEELFSSAHLFLMPGAQGYGLPALEALARRVPVILHRESGVSEILAATPSVAIIEGGMEQLTSAMQGMMATIRSREIADVMPSFPTEDEWAREISTVCQWI